MGCQSSVILNEDLAFSICTHDPDTLAQADADSLPAYRLYEVDVETPILTGTMPKLDDANTLGYYLKKITCSTANGFELDKSYSIYIRAAVGGVYGAISFNFSVVDRATTLGSGLIAWTYHITWEETGLPISGVYVWVTTDFAGTNIVCSGYTDAFGDVVFNLKAGTYYFWRQRAGTNFTNPDTEVVS